MSKFFINRPIFASVISIVIVLAGLAITLALALSILLMKLRYGDRPPAGTGARG